MVKSEKITLGSLNPNNYNFKIKYSARRMKLYIKLTQEETTGWKNVKNALAAGMSDDDLAKILFFKAKYKAAVSTTPPLAVLIKIAPFLIFFIFSLLIK